MQFGCGFGLALAVGVALSTLFSAGASAQQNIGSAALAHNDVSRELAGSSKPLVEGESVFRDETVRTGADSTAKLVFLDSTALAVGPISRVLLDRFVYDASPTSQAMAVNLAKGVFRFTTGVLDKKAYSITTPTASIGVRGTVLDIGVATKRTRVTLVEGAAFVCPRSKGEAFEQVARDCAKNGAASGACDCVVLDQPGRTASVVSGKGGTRASVTDTPVKFASLCAQDPELCAGAQYAGWGPGALCGR